MARNRVREDLVSGTNWVAPPGVTGITVETKRTRPVLYPMLSFVDEYGNIFSAGAGALGVLGNGSVSNSNVLVQALGGVNFSQLISNIAPDAMVCGFAIAKNSGLAYSWGANSIGQLGLGDVVPRSSPVAVLRSLVVSKIIATSQASFFLTPSGDLYSCGNNTSGFLGVGDVTHRSSPVAVLGSLKFAQVVLASNGGTAYGITPSGVAYGWGTNISGQLGNGNVTPRSSPVAVLGSLIVKKIASAPASGGDGSAIILTTSGTLYGMGQNQFGELGVGDIIPRSSPVAVVGVSGITFVDIGTIGQATLGTYWAISSTGQLYMWGLNSNGELGNGSVNSKSSPVQVIGALSGVAVQKVVGADIGSGTRSVIAITTAGVAYGWGSNTKGCLGLGDTTPRSSPVAVLGSLTIADFVMFSSVSNDISVWAVTTSGVMYAWGGNTLGELALGDNTARSSPVAVVGAALPNFRPVLERQLVPVTPGTTYAIAYNQYGAFFGNQCVGNNYVDSMTIEYFA